MPASRRFGILNVAKPAGLTSRAVVDPIAKLVRPEKAGHAGTLDPMATGVLVVCVGKATRLIDLLQQQVKSYEARFVLGCESDTDDVTGKVTPVVAAGEISRKQIEDLLPSFRGRILQVPPAFSAVHVNGVRAYELARSQKQVEITPREVDVYRLEMTRFAYPEFDLSIDCGSGTYIRSIGRDIGRALGCGAVMSSLVRTRIGPYRLEEAVPLEQLTADSIDRWLLSPTTAAADLPQQRARDEDIVQIQGGRPIGLDAATTEIADGTTVAVLDRSGGLLCLAEVNLAERRLLPRRVLID